MGSSYPRTKQEIKEDKKHEDQFKAEEENEQRKISTKIVMILVDRIVAEIIRPGPKPEERECYQVAGELRAIVPFLEDLVRSILVQEAEDSNE